MISLLSALESQGNYAATIPLRQKILEGDSNARDNSLQAIVHVLSNVKGSPMSKLLALKLAQDTIDLFNDQYVSAFQTLVLPKIEEICTFLPGNPDPERGRTMFTNQPNVDKDAAIIGNSLLRMALECIWVWNKWFPVDPDTMVISAYKITFERLIMKKVKFPALIYFDPKAVAQQMPDCLVPLIALHQCQAVIRPDFNRKIPLPYKKLQVRLLNLQACLLEKHKLVHAIERVIAKIRKRKEKQTKETKETPNQKPIKSTPALAQQQSPWQTSRSSQRPLTEFQQASQQFNTSLVFIDSQHPGTQQQQTGNGMSKTTNPTTSFSNQKLRLPKQASQKSKDF